MNTIRAYQCTYCNKVYAVRDSARSHERKCYFNPATQSCVCCTFLDRLNVDLAPGHYTEFQVCLKNEDITIKLRTACPLYHQVEYDDELGIQINTPSHSFDRDLALDRLSGKIARLKEQHQLQQKELSSEAHKQEEACSSNRDLL